MELAATIDAGMPFVKATYNLEGDGPLALTCYDAISALNMSARQAYYPNLDAIAAHIVSNAQEESDLVQHAKSCVQPGIAYYFEQVSTNMKPALEAFKAARLFSPFRLIEINPSVTAIDSLGAFPLLGTEIPALKQELPLYQAAARDVDLRMIHLFFGRITKLACQRGLKQHNKCFLCSRHQQHPSVSFGFEKFIWRETKFFFTRLHRDLSDVPVQ